MSVKMEEEQTRKAAVASEVAAPGVSTEQRFSIGQTSRQRSEAPVKMGVDELNFYYGKSLALKAVSLDATSNLVTAFI